MTADAGLRVGISERFGAPGHDLAWITRIARATEAAGFDSFWSPEHLAVFDDRSSRFAGGGASLADSPSFPDPFVTLTAVAAATSSLLVGTAITLMPLVSPLTVARAGATLDALSGGRFVLGAGVGWQPREYDALGVGWADRGQRMTEHVEAVLALWTQSPACYEGEFVRFDSVIAEPRPVSTPHPPVLIGGDSDSALRRAARLGGGWFGWGQSGDSLRRILSRLDGLLDEVGRSRDGFTIQIGTRFDGRIGPLRAFAKEACERGVDRLVVTCGPQRAIDEDDLASIAEACLT